MHGSSEQRGWIRARSDRRRDGGQQLMRKATVAAMRTEFRAIGMKSGSALTRNPSRYATSCVRPRQSLFRGMFGRPESVLFWLRRCAPIPLWYSSRVRLVCARSQSLIERENV